MTSGDFDVSVALQPVQFLESSYFCKGGGGGVG